MGPSAGLGGSVKLDTVMKFCVFLIIVTLSASGWSQSQQPSSNPKQASQTFDGKWWLNAEAEERSGYINGASDCLTWTAHEKGFNSTPEQVAEKITRFYKAHPEARSLIVVDAWKKVEERLKPTKIPDAGAETWKNAHWYLNGNWWGSISSLEKKGYLEGYLWCMDNRVEPKSDSYSQSVSFYQKKINSYVDTHPKSDAEAVAIILHRFRDRDAESTKP
jgi:hypothetical protein